MKRKIINCTIFLIILVLCVNFASNILQDKSSEYKNSDFFSEKNQFDVLFFGSSHMELFVSPLEMWKDYGFISYNFGNPEEGIPITYHVIKNAIEVNKPKVVVVETYMFNLSGKYSSASKLHYGLDSFPLNKTKIDSVIEMTDNTNDFLEMFFCIGKYHENWKILNRGSFENTEHFYKGNMSYGYYHTMKVSPYEQFEHIPGENEVPEDSKDYIYIKKIIELCKEKGIKLIFVSMPYMCDEFRQKNVHVVERIANENNVQCLNLIELNSVIDMKTDMYDDGHVNQSGMQKVSYYLGEWLTKNCELTDHRNDSSYAKWDKDYSEFTTFKTECINNSDDLYVTLEMLHDDSYSANIFVGKDVVVEDNDEFLLLLQNIPRRNINVCSGDSEKSENEYPLNKLSEYAFKDNYYFSNASGEVTEFTGEEAIEKIVKEYPEYESNTDKIIIVIKDSSDGKTVGTKVF